MAENKLKRAAFASDEAPIAPGVPAAEPIKADGCACQHVHQFQQLFVLSLSD